MSTTAGKILHVSASEPRRRGLAWFVFNVRRVLRLGWANLLMRFISLLGSVSTPGMKPVGALQAWALRRMGATCRASTIWIGPRVAIDFPGGLVLGHRVVIGADARLTARARITVGDDFLSAPGLWINTGTHEVDTLVPQQGPITIGPGVWCGTRVTICAGVTIGAGAVVGAGSLVVASLPPRHISVGVPCRPLRPTAAAAREGRPRWSNFRKA